MRRATIIIGKGRALEQACGTARDNRLDCLRIELNSSDRYNFNTGPLFENYAAAESEVFVALDERTINYARHKLIAEIRLAGYQLFNIVSSSAIVSINVRLLGNVYIGPGCNLAGPCSIGTGSWLDQQVIVEGGVVSVLAPHCRLASISDGRSRSARAVRWEVAASLPLRQKSDAIANGCCQACSPRRFQITHFTIVSCQKGHTS